MDLILKYFKRLSNNQIEQFEALSDLYFDWNSKINVISRKDIGNLYERHILHSLAIAKIISFRPETTVLDVGTGGGFPGIPLAIFFPEVRFHLIDSTGKKIKVATEVSKSVALENITFRQCRLEEEKAKFDFVVSRAVMPLQELARLSQKNIQRENPKNSLPNGLICLKGGELTHEILPFRQKASEYALKEFFKEEFFSTKKAVYLPL